MIGCLLDGSLGPPAPDVHAFVCGILRDQQIMSEAMVRDNVASALLSLLGETHSGDASCHLVRLTNLLDAEIPVIGS